MASSLEKELLDLKINILKMASLAEEALVEALRALNNRDGALASQVIESDDQLNALENTIDEQCLRLLAL